MGYTAWNGETYDGEPPSDWYLASDNRWWPNSSRQEPAQQKSRTELNAERRNSQDRESHNSSEQTNRPNERQRIDRDRPALGPNESVFGNDSTLPKNQGQLQPLPKPPPPRKQKSVLRQIFGTGRLIWFGIAAVVMITSFIRSNDEPEIVSSSAELETDLSADPDQGNFSQPTERLNQVLQPPVSQVNLSAQNLVVTITRCSLEGNSVTASGELLIRPTPDSAEANSWSQLELQLVFAAQQSEPKSTQESTQKSTQESTQSNDKTFRAVDVFAIQKKTFRRPSESTSSWTLASKESPPQGKDLFACAISEATVKQ